MIHLLLEKVIGMMYPFLTLEEVIQKWKDYFGKTEFYV